MAYKYLLVVLVLISCFRQKEDSPEIPKSLDEFIFWQLDTTEIERLVKLEWNDKNVTIAIVKSAFYHKNDSTQEYINKELFLFLKNQAGYQKILLDTLTNEGGPTIIKEIYTANADEDELLLLFLNSPAAIR